MEFGSPVRHQEQDVSWFRVPLKTPYVLTLTKEGLSDARTSMIQTLLQSKGLFASRPTLQQLGTLAPSWISSPTGLPDSPSWSPLIRWNPPKPTGSLSVQVTAIWISRSSIIPEVRGTVTSQYIELDFSHPELEEVNEIEASEGTVHLRSFDVVRHETNAEVNRLWRVARTATEAAEAAEDAFFQKYGDPFSEDSDDSDDSQ
jgi:hypothetical protein